MSWPLGYDIPLSLPPLSLSFSQSLLLSLFSLIHAHECTRTHIQSLTVSLFISSILHLSILHSSIHPSIHPSISPSCLVRPTRCRDQLPAPKPPRLPRSLSLSLHLPRSSSLSAILPHPHLPGTPVSDYLARALILRGNVSDSLSLSLSLSRSLSLCLHFSLARALTCSLRSLSLPLHLLSLRPRPLSLLPNTPFLPSISLPPLLPTPSLPPFYSRAYRRPAFTTLPSNIYYICRATNSGRICDIKLFRVAMRSRNADLYLLHQIHRKSRTVPCYSEERKINQ